MAVILIVDDDPTLRAVATELLRTSDHCVVEAADGVEALQLLDRLPIDLIVLDMLMPNMDGLEVLTAIRASQARVPVLAISSGGSMDAEYLLRCAKAFGANEVMLKPLRHAAFAGAVNRLVDGRDFGTSLIKTCQMSA
ncbi:MAG: response regulator [Oxalobacteraceae bacterium]|nr:MAG: response regulator [Oxalobacteraceae bacterium]